MMVNIKFCGHSYGQRISSNDSCKYGRSIVELITMVHSNYGE